MKTYLKVLKLLVTITWFLGANIGNAQTVIPLLPELSPSKSAEIYNQFHEALVKGLGQSSFTALPVKGKAGQGCFQGVCIKDALSKYKAEGAITARIQITEKNYLFTVRFYKGDSLLTKTESRCDICTLLEAQNTLIETVVTLAKQAQGSFGAIPLTKPASTKAAGETSKPPITKSKISDGGKSDSALVPLDKSAQQDEKVGASKSPALENLDESTTQVASKRFPLWPGIATAGTGLVSLIVGISLIAIDGEGTNCIGEPLPGNRNCTDLYSTGGGGYALTTIGLASLTGSGILFYMHFKKPSKKSAARDSLWGNLKIGPTQGGIFFSTESRF